MTADPTRAGVVSAIVDKTGKTPEQAEAFLNIVGSAFARRGWVDGDPLPPAEIERNLSTFVGDGTCSCESYDCRGECCGPGNCSCTPTAEGDLTR